MVDAAHQRFGIRTVQQFRDDDEQYPELGRGGSFYLKVNGRDFLVRGATYTPDLLFKYDPDRETAILRYVKDLGLNMIRLEGKFPGDHLIETADELGIPVMYGWMCCNQWEKWAQWDDEDRGVAQDSMRSQIEAAALARRRPSSGPTPATAARRRRFSAGTTASCPTCTGRTRRSTPSPRSTGTTTVNRLWDGIQMAGPYSWRPPSYWFAGRYAATRGASAEQGDNEHIPPFASLKSFIPADKLWPINDTWYFHAGSDDSNEQLDSIRTAIVRRYGSSKGAEEFTRKAQLAHYESTRAQFEAFAAGGWDTPQDDHLLDAQQPLAVVLRQPVRLLPAARRRVLRREEGSAAAVGRVRLLRHRRPQPGQHQRRQPVRRRPGRSAGAGADLRPAGPVTRRPRRRRHRRRRQRCEPGHDAAPGGTQLTGVLRPLRPDGLHRRRRGRQRLLAVPAAR